MKMPIVCPACGATGQVDDALAGREVHCRHCRHLFTIPRPGEEEPDVYALEEPGAASKGRSTGDPGSTFVPAGGGASSDAPKRAGQRTRPRAARRGGADLSWSPWLIRCGLFLAGLLSAVSLFAPGGAAVAGVVLAVVGAVMVLVGYGAGAYGAFREDLLYGILYLAIPLYTAYYIVTRWDDLWPWFACSAAGAALVALGTWLTPWLAAG